MWAESVPRTTEFAFSTMAFTLRARNNGHMIYQGHNPSSPSWPKLQGARQLTTLLRASASMVNFPEVTVVNSRMGNSDYW